MWSYAVIPLPPINFGRDIFYLFISLSQLKIEDLI